MLNIEFADEILDFLSEFINSYIPIQGVTTNTDYNTIYSIPIPTGKNYMISLSVIGRYGNSRAGLKRTAVFFNSGSGAEQVKIQQSDFTSRDEDGFNARIIAREDNILIQVKSANVAVTKWKGSIKLDLLGE
jgi:hypothetical protein